MPQVRFTSGHPPVQLPERAELARSLTVQNSPVLFGCRTGICGTCASIVVVERGEVPPPDEEEQEILELSCPDEPRARLLCQLKLTGDILVSPLSLQSPQAAKAGGDR